MGECVCFLIVIIRKTLLKRKLLVISPVHPVLETIIAAAAIAVVRDREPQGLVVQPVQPEQQAPPVQPEQQAQPVPPERQAQPVQPEQTARLVLLAQRQLRQRQWQMQLVQRML